MKEHFDTVVTFESIYDNDTNSYFDNYINREHYSSSLTKMDVDLDEVLKIAKEHIDTPDYKPMMEEYRFLKRQMEERHRNALVFRYIYVALRKWNKKNFCSYTNRN